MPLIPHSIDAPTARLVIDAALESIVKRPPGYPLPVTREGVAYWNINGLLCLYVEGWREWQAKRDMAQIIPVIEALRA